MTRFLLLWIVLGVTLAVTTIASSYVLFNVVDLTFEGFAHLVVVPACQALFVALVVGKPGGMSPLRAIRAAAGHPLAGPVLWLDVAVLAAAWMLRPHYLLGVGGQASLLPFWTANKAVAGAILLLWVAIRRGQATGPAVHQPSRAERCWLAAYAITLLPFAANAWLPWLHAVPAALGGPIVLRWLAAYTPLFVLAAGTTIGAAGALRRGAPAAAAHLDIALALAVVCAIVAVLQFFLKPYLEEPWLSTVRTLTSLSATFVLLAAITAAYRAEATGSVARQGAV